MGSRTKLVQLRLYIPFSGDQDTDQLTLHVAGDRGEWLTLWELPAWFASRYTNPKTSYQYRAGLTALFGHVGFFASSDDFAVGRLEPETTCPPYPSNFSAICNSFRLRKRVQRL